MCGILGLVAPSGQLLSERDSDISAMRDIMTPRGPDDAGFFRKENIAFAHRRLSIRDLEAGRQPWLSPTEDCILVYNGELYNDGTLRRELTQRGHEFRTRGCDTEVVLAAYQEWGVDCLTRFRGMFALGIYDFPERQLILARDRFGIKPLFVMMVGHTLLFASSVAALLRHPSASKRPNWHAVSHYLTTFRITLGRETMFQGIWQLLPGEVLVWRDGSLQIQRYWDYPNERDEVTFAEATERVRSGLQHAVETRLVSDVPVGMFLSGGVDSNTIACFVRGASENRELVGGCGGGKSINPKPPHAPLDDFTAAQRCAQHVRFDYRKVQLEAGDYYDTWQDLVRQQSLPLATPTDVILYRLALEMKQVVGVVLGGEGADELLCGYEIPHWSGHDFDLACELAKPTGLSPSVQRLIRASLESQYGRAGFSSLVDHYFALNSLIPLSAKPALFRPEIYGLFDDDAPLIKYYAESLTEHTEETTSERYLRLLHRVNLESLLSRLDSATMQAGLEARVPFTDHHLVESVFRIPIEQKIDVTPSESAPYLSSGELSSRGSLRSKRPLRKVASEMMPHTLAFRPKASFPTPVAEWIADPWQESLREKLLTSPFGQAVFEPNALAELANNLPHTGMWVWPIMNLLEWGDQQFAA
ncbi:MAG: asparagine synthase (glutamine-hydrolyzing) [Planctomycetaceae bacterium]|nr:asparagine synthase (glutamine-hydrolyzing) [Planctomycetaceae bacterium]